MIMTETHGLLVSDRVGVVHGVAPEQRRLTGQAFKLHSTELAEMFCLGPEKYCSVEVAHTLKVWTFEDSFDKESGILPVRVLTEHVFQGRPSESTSILSADIATDNTVAVGHVANYAGIFDIEKGV
jgi:hypothetical protein